MNQSKISGVMKSRIFLVDMRFRKFRQKLEDTGYDIPRK